MYQYFDKILNKYLSCDIVPGILYTKIIKDQFRIIDMIYYCEVTYNVDTTTADQILKYGSRLVDINDIYPADTQTEIDYHTSCITTCAVDKPTELQRFLKIITDLTNVTELDTEMFYNLCNFVSYELLFKYLTHDERIFFQMLSFYNYNTLADVPEPILAPDLLRMTSRLFSKYSGTLNVEHEMFNYKHYYEHDSIFPIILNVQNISHNVQLISPSL
jgi:hypothetical protein